MEEIREFMDEKLDEAHETFKKGIECICPKCGEKHVMDLMWIGRGTPRKFCGKFRNSGPLDI